MDNVEESLKLMINDERNTCAFYASRVQDNQAHYEAHKRKLDDLETALQVYQERKAFVFEEHSSGGAP